MTSRTARSSGRASWEAFLTHLDRRIIYLGLFLFTFAPLLFDLRLPVYVTPPVRAFHDTVEALPPDRVVVIAANWDAGTFAENQPQTIALFRHLMRRELRFVIVSIAWPNSPQLVQNALQEAIRQEFGAEHPPDRYPVYGVDYVNAGYRVRNLPWIRSLVRDPATALQADWKGRPLQELPLFRDLRNLPDDASLVVDITSTDTAPDWISLVGSEGVPISLACTAVVAPEQYPYLATNQLRGMLTGMRGAAEYEQLLGYEGQAARMMGGQSFAHLYLFILIFLGNVALMTGWWSRGRRR